MKIGLFIVVASLVFQTNAFSSDIGGIWKAEKGEAWVEIDLAAGKGTVVRNDKYPERVGRVILKNLQAQKSKHALWRGMIYIEKMGEFKKVEVTLPEPTRMITKGKVGFLSRSMEWRRVDSSEAISKVAD